MNKRISVSGAGCGLIDNLYHHISFESKNFSSYLSKSPGDGGLTPGKLVFTEEFEQFSGKKFDSIIKDLTGGRKPDVRNIGGPSIVALLHAAQVLHEYPVKFRYFGAIGNDENGEELKRMLNKVPLVELFLKEVKETTSYTDVFSDPSWDHGHGERVFVNNIGAAWNLSPDDLDSQFWESDIHIFGGTALVPGIQDHLQELLMKSKNLGKITIVNTVYDFRNEKKSPEKKWPLGKDDHTYEYIDLLITDYEEAIRLSGKETEEEILEYFCDSGVSSFIITHGANPTICWSDGRFFSSKGVFTFPVYSEIRNKIEKYPQGDTTGCGDNFCGGVLSMITKQMSSGVEIGEFDLQEAAIYGTVSGGLTCLYPGGVYYEKEKGEKEKRLKAFYNDYRKTGI